MTAPSATAKSLAACYAQVVVPVDFSPASWRSLTLAKRMARAFAVPLHALHVDTSSPWLEEGVNSLTVRGGPGGRQVEVDVVAARSTVDGITRVLGDDEGSLLVMSTHGHSAAAEFAVGSTAEGLLRRWRGSMLLTGPRYRVSAVPYRRIVVCLDPASAVTAPALIDDVRAWATTFDIPVEVLSVVHPEPSSDFDGILRQNERVEAAAAALSTDERVAKIVRLEGKRPGQDIARYADSVEGTLVALATHARRPTVRAVFGSTAMTVLRHVASPVLVRRFPTR